MEIDRIAACMRESGLGGLALEPLALDEAKRLLSAEHYQNLLGAFAVDLKLQLAVTRLNQAGFNRLILAELDETRAITAEGRSIGEISNFIKKRNIDVETLVTNWLDPVWAQRVREYYDEFDAGLGSLLISSPVPSELAQTADGRWYLSDGNHRALALAYRSNIEGRRFEGIRAVICHCDRQKVIDAGLKI